MASPYRRQFAFIALLALTATGLDLVEPLIYRSAINDIAGLFADRFDDTQPPNADSLEEGSAPALESAPAPRHSHTYAHA